MTDLSRAFDEELRARLTSLARALRSFKILKEKNGDTARYGQILPTHARNGQIVPHTGQTRKNMLKIYAKRFQNARRERNGAQRTPPGSRMERKGCHKGTKGLLKGCQMEPTAPQRNPKGAKRAPKGGQNDTKMTPKCTQNDPKMHPAALLEKIMKTTEFLTAKMLPKLSNN